MPSRSDPEGRKTIARQRRSRCGSRRGGGVLLEGEEEQAGAGRMVDVGAGAGVIVARAVRTRPWAVPSVGSASRGSPSGAEEKLTPSTRARSSVRDVADGGDLTVRR